jgi:hypothetical protein
MAWKVAAPVDLWREHVLLNPGSFSTTTGTDSDDFRESSGITSGLPARPTHRGDSTAYATPPIYDSWTARLRGWINRGANVTGGQLT